MWYQTLTATTGALWSSLTTTVSPFGSVKRVNGMSIVSGAAADAPPPRPAVSMSAARPRPKGLRMESPG